MITTKQLQDSKKSSNFWTGVATIGSALISGIVMVYLDNSGDIKSLTFGLLVAQVLHNAANILSHMNKDNTSAAPETTSVEGLELQH